MPRYCPCSLPLDERGKCARCDGAALGKPGVRVARAQRGTKAPPLQPRGEGNVQEMVRRSPEPSALHRQYVEHGRRVAAKRWRRA